jgi:ATP-dependent DNA ligase
MTLEVPLTVQPMEALPVDDLPKGKGWLFEPKYDGFRCILFRDGDLVYLQSRRQRPLGRYFPELIAAATHLPIQRFVFDGELIIPDEPFDTLQLRLHPAASRVQSKRPACDVLHRRVELSRLRTMVGSPVRVCAAAEERADDAGRNCMLLRLRRIQ